MRKSKLNKSKPAVKTSGKINSENPEALDDNNTEQSVQPQENEKPEKIPICYKTFFQYTKEYDEKIGVCLQCKKSNIVKEIRMKTSNTSGLKYHLNENHKKEYEQLHVKKSAVPRLKLQPQRL